MKSCDLGRVHMNKSTKGEFYTARHNRKFNIRLSDEISFNFHIESGADCVIRFKRVGGN